MEFAKNGYSSAGAEAICAEVCSGVCSEVFSEVYSEVCSEVCSEVLFGKHPFLTKGSKYLHERDEATSEQLAARTV